MPFYIVELIGASGTGKTTVARKIVATLIEKGVAAAYVNVYRTKHQTTTNQGSRNHWRRLLAVDILSVLSNPLLAIWCIVNIHRHGRHSQWAHIRQLVVLCQSSHHVKRLKERSESIVLVDEGPNKVVTTLLARGCRFPNWLHRCTPKPDLCIVLHAHENVAIQRLRERSDLGVTDEEARQILHDHAKAAEIMTPLAPIMEVDNGTSEVPIAYIIDEILRRSEMH